MTDVDKVRAILAEGPFGQDMKVVEVPFQHGLGVRFEYGDRIAVLEPKSDYLFVWPDRICRHVNDAATAVLRQLHLGSRYVTMIARQGLTKLPDGVFPGHVHEAWIVGPDHVDGTRPRGTPLIPSHEWNITVWKLVLRAHGLKPGEDATVVLAVKE